MKTTRITLTALGVLALGACGSTGGAGSDNGESKPSATDLQGKTYAIASVEGEAKSEKLMDDSKLTIEFTQDEQIKVDTDCNQLNGDVEFDGDTMKVDRLQGTLMGCPQTRTDQEAWANDLVKSEPEWSLDGKKLYLTSDGMTVELTENGK